MGPLETLKDCTDLGTVAVNHYHEVYGIQYTQVIIKDSALSLVTTRNIFTNHLNLYIHKRDNCTRATEQEDVGTVTS